MFKKSMLIISALSMVAVPAAADARHYHGYDGYGQGYDGRYEQGYYPQQVDESAHYGDGYNYRRHRCSGTTGTIVGAGAGALIGRSIGRGSGYHRHSGTTGAIIGAALGALAGREVGRSTC